LARAFAVVKARADASYVPVVVAEPIGVVVGAVVFMGVFGKTLVEVAFVSADVREVSSEIGTVDVDVSRTVVDAALGELLLGQTEEFNVGAVEVELTKGGAFAMYEPSACTAYSPSPSPCQW
jgi:hypothetical protein